jgi:hypothetical protein
VTKTFDQIVSEYHDEIEQVIDEQRRQQEEHEAAVNKARDEYRRRLLPWLAEVIDVSVEDLTEVVSLSYSFNHGYRLRQINTIDVTISIPKAVDVAVIVHVRFNDGKFRDFTIQNGKQWAIKVRRQEHQYFETFPEALSAAIDQFTSNQADAERWEAEEREREAKEVCRQAKAKDKQDSMNRVFAVLAEDPALRRLFDLMVLMLDERESARYAMESAWDSYYDLESYNSRRLAQKDQELEDAERSLSDTRRQFEDLEDKTNQLLREQKNESFW